MTNTQEGLQDKYRIEKGEVTFDNVGFRYTGGENDVLQHISFRANPGETIALVGATGSAKSSLVQLIPRLYDATSGEIRIDGIPVKNYNLDELHARIGMVLQKNELFTGTIIDNLRWGKPDASMAEIEEAAVPPKHTISSAPSPRVTTRCWDAEASMFPAARNNASALPVPCSVNRKSLFWTIAPVPSIPKRN